MENYRLALIEDEDIHIRSMKAKLKHYEEENQVTFSVTCFRSGEDFLNQYKKDFDLIFMDIMLKGKNGMETAHELRKVDSYVPLIFMTSFSQFALEGYTVSALDYIMKPVSYYDFQLKLKKALVIVGKKKKRKIIAIGKEEVKMIDVDDLVYIEVRGHHLLYHLNTGSIIDVCGSLSKLEKELSENNFSRCNSCYLINMNYIRKMDSSSVVLKTDVTLQISKRKKKDFYNAVMTYMENI